MEAMIAATFTAVGSLAMAVLQARTARRESGLLQGHWDVEPVMRMPNLRRDDAHQQLSPATAMKTAKRSAKKVHISFAQAEKQRSEVLDRKSDEEFSHWDDAESTFEEATSAVSPDTPQEKVPLESLRFAPFLLESTTLVAWGVLWGVFFLAGLIGPQINANFTQWNALFIPLVTLTLSATYPLPWAWAAVVVGCLQGANCLGYWLAGQSFQTGDGNFCVAIYFLNALAVALVSAYVMQRHRQMIVMKPQ